MRIIEDGHLCVLTEESLSELTEVFEKGIVEIELDGEDLVLSAAYQPPNQEGSSTYWHESVGQLKLQAVIEYAVHILIDDQPPEARARLLAISGLLREIASNVDKHAEELSDNPWGLGVVPTVRGMKEIPSEDEEEVDRKNLE